jgi:hypothetical protein
MSVRLFQPRPIALALPVEMGYFGALENGCAPVLPRKD